MSSAAFTLPADNAAVRIASTGGPDAMNFARAPVAAPAATQLLIRNSYAGVNYIDTYHRSGLYPLQTPFTLGREGAGRIAAVGEGVPAEYGLNAGDRVVYFGAPSYAEYTAIDATTVMKIPDEVQEKDAAAVLLQGMTAWGLLTRGMDNLLQRGDWILVHAAAGGVGQLLCQMASAKLGARVIGTASTSKLGIAKSAGCEHVIDYTAAGVDVAVEVRKLTGGEGVRAVFDGVGKDTFDASLASLARCGHMLSFGNASGKIPPVDILRLSKSNLKLSRPALFQWTVTREEFVDLSAGVLKMLAEGKISVNVWKEYSLKDIESVRQSHRDLEGRKTTGKLVIACE